MKWKVVYTSHARQDLRSIYSYIANKLLEPETAAGQTQRIMEEIRSLDEMPMRFYYMMMSRGTVKACGSFL